MSKNRRPAENPEVEADIALDEAVRLADAETATSRSVRIASSPDEEADEAERSLEQASAPTEDDVVD
jgi:hypothetical protein